MVAAQIQNSGRWLVGNAGAERSITLVKKLRAERAQQVNARFGLGFPQYTPWHSLVPVSTAASALLPRAHQDQSLVSDPQTLSLLSDILQGDGGYPFATLKKHPDFQSRIHTEVAQSADAFTAITHRAVSVLKDSAPWLQQEVDATIDCLVPIYCAPGGKFIKRGMSCADTHGAVFITLLGRNPQSARVELAVDIAHELGHHLLMGYQLCDPILTSSPDAPVYSGVRKTFRPAILAVHAACALTFMIAASHALLEHPGLTLAERTFLSAWLPQLGSALDLTLKSLTMNCQFTQMGQALHTEFTRVMGCR